MTYGTHMLGGAVVGVVVLSITGVEQNVAPLILGSAIMGSLLPDIDHELFSYIGNSSLSGAYAMLTSVQSEEKVGELARSMTYLELSTEPGYMDAFVAACFLPHTDAQLFPSVQVG